MALISVSEPRGEASGEEEHIDVCEEEKTEEKNSQTQVGPWPSREMSCSAENDPFSFFMFGSISQTNIAITK